MKLMDSKTVFLLGLIVAGSGLVSPPVALVGGTVFALLVKHPLKVESQKLSKTLLQVAVVLLGFGMNLREVLRVGRAGFAYTAVSITGALALGLLLGKAMKVGGKSSFLIAIGTAICGGSAIAAVAPITEATEEQISVSMGTIFLLNSVALVLFPVIGHALHLSQNQFGWWAALAIHDTSSVVGAGAAYGTQALVVGTTVKLARALWIVPVSLATAAYMRRGRGGEGGAKVKMPWFILLFCAAAAVKASLPQFGGAYGVLNTLGKTGLTATLFLIGTGLSKQTLKQVGVRPLVQGVLLWVVVAAVSLTVIARGVISI
jgi:uncharacterized integral membrane protein (TIGR00698 family)